MAANAASPQMSDLGHSRKRHKGSAKSAHRFKSDIRPKELYQPRVSFTFGSRQQIAHIDSAGNEAINLRCADDAANLAVVDISECSVFRLTE
jgi:hypothetical protein